MNVLFVFAHQDDEIAAATRILLARRNGDHVICAYLTNGALESDAAVRNEESRRALARLGVTDLHFASLPDGHLPERASDALAFLDLHVADAGEVCTLAWEGGHQDHDAAHMIAVAFAQRRCIRCIEVPLYNGFGTRGQWFRVMHPAGDGWTKRKIGLGEALRVIALIRFYRTQRTSWLGLLPETLLKLVVLRRELVRDADVRRLNARPHEGALLYERRFSYPWERFERTTADFRASLTQALAVISPSD